MSNFAAVLDANVLYSHPLTSVLLELAEARLYRPIWSNDIHEEWIRAVTRGPPGIAPEKLERKPAYPWHIPGTPQSELDTSRHLPRSRLDRAGITSPMVPW